MDLVKMWKAFDSCCGPGSTTMVAEDEDAPKPKQSGVLVQRRGEGSHLRSVTIQKGDGYHLQGSPGTTPDATPRYEGSNDLGTPTPRPNFFQSHSTPAGTPVPAGSSSQDVREEEEVRLAGVGIIFRKGHNDEGLVVDGLMPNCPIHTRTHIKQGMKLVKVAGRDVTYASQIDIAPLILGPLGTFVELQFERPGRRPSMEHTWKYRRGSMSFAHVQVERFHEIKFR